MHPAEMRADHANEEADYRAIAALLRAGAPSPDPEAERLAAWCEAEADMDAKLMRSTHPARREDECDTARGLKLRAIALRLRVPSPDKESA